MKLSVVIPTYNRKDSLRRTLDGLSRQAYPAADFEAVVVSDGSTDGTDEMLAEYAKSAPFSLRTIAQPNSGPSAARNRGYREAQHEVIVFLDDDVEPVPEFLSRHAAHHAADAHVVVLGPMSPDPACAHEEPVWIAWEHAKLQQTYDFFRPGGKHAGDAPRSVHFFSGNASVHRQWLEAVGGFDETFKRQEDVELAARMELACSVHFQFDFAADGLHRPNRTFESWLRIPFAYGTLDAQRVPAGQVTLEAIREAAHSRSRATRLLSGIVLTLPFLFPCVTMILRSLASMLYRCGSVSPALAALSGLYNATYTWAFEDGLRTHSDGSETVRAVSPVRAE
jgi:glycosyltransferase involved in cell wall biosynthesis